MVVDANMNYLMIAATVVLPLLVGLVTKRVASSGLKALLLLILSVLATLINQLIVAEGHFEMEPFLRDAVVQFVLAVGLHYGLLKPIGVTGTNGIIQQKVTGGIGGQVDASDPNQTGV